MRSMTPYEIAAFQMGARVERALPDGRIRGRFLFKGTITDNAITASSLVAAATARDKKLLDVAGLAAAIANPKIVLRAERIGFGLIESTELPGVLADLFQETEMTHTPAGGAAPSRVLQMHEFWAGSLYHAVAAGATTELTGTLLKARDKIPTFHVPFSPLIIDMERDTWSIAPRTAVNSGANVTYFLLVDGIAHVNAGFTRQRAACSDDDRLQLAKDLHDSEASDALYLGKRAPRLVIQQKRK